MSIARAKLKGYMALFDRAYYAWTPQIKMDSIVAPLPERRELRQCVSLSTPTDPLNELGEVFPCPGQDITTDERITADTEIGILVKTSIDVIFPIYTFGKVAHGQDAARAGLDIGEAGIEYARGELDYLVRKAYYGAQLADTALGILRDGRKRLAKAKKEIEGQLSKDTGRFTSNDLRKLLVDEAELESGFLETEALNQQAWSALRLAANLRPDSTMTLDKMAITPVNLEPRSREAYIELAMNARPSMRIARAAVRARESQMKMALAGFFPDIALVGGFRFAKGTTADDPIDPFANDSYNSLSWGVVLGAKWNVDYAVLSSKYSQAQAKLSQQRAEYELLVQKIRLELVEQVSDMERRKKELKVRRIAMKAARAWLVSNTMNFGIGVATVDQLLKSLVAYSKARLTYYRTIYEFNLSVARLSQSVGSDLAVPNSTE